jgi:electron transport complex protein RnfB
MSEDVYRKLAKVLDTLPNGFPATDTGVEIKLLKKIFTPDEAELFCDLRLTPETARQIAVRTGRSLEGLEKKLTDMWYRGEVGGSDVDGVKMFHMIPWVIGLFEFHMNRMDREFAELCEEFSMYFGPQLVMNPPHIMQVLPVERDIPVEQAALPYRQVSHVIDNGRSFRLAECVCKHEKDLLDKPCPKPTEVCLGISSTPHGLDSAPFGRTITQQEAYEVLDLAEKAGLVHLTTNVQSGHWFICNCCGCCCGVLNGVKLLGAAAVTNSAYYAEIDPELCEACGVCADERCQVNAIEEGADTYQVIKERCIGCGLCVSTCPTEAIHLVRKDESEIVTPPRNEDEWLDIRAKSRGVDYSAYK